VNAINKIHNKIKIQYSTQHYVTLPAHKRYFICEYLCWSCCCTL